MFARQGIALYLLLIGLGVWANESEDTNYAVTPTDGTSLFLNVLNEREKMYTYLRERL